MRRACDVCGEGYEAQRATSRYCSTRCRTRKSRGAKAIGEVKALPQSVGPVEAATRAELEAAGRVDSPLGQAALALARRLDEANDPLTGMASGVKQLQATLEAATADAVEAADPVDELQALRDRKRAAAG